MGHWLAKPGDAAVTGHMKRFDPRFWTVEFPRPMMASVVTTGPASLKVDTVFYRSNDLAGLIWEAADRFDHPLLGYETSRDFRECVLSFRWQSGGVLPLNAVNGPTLTIEGRDAGGQARAWYVRLWNYASGSPTDATITLDFATLKGGFLLPSEADPVWAGDVDRMFISLVPPGYSGQEAPLPQAVEGQVRLDGITCSGAGSNLSLGDTVVPPHGFSAASSYDDAYNQTPERMLRNMFHLGYRDDLDHYVGMSHYFRLEALYGGYYVSLAGGALNRPCAAWHEDFAARSRLLGYRLIMSLSYELFDAHSYNDWKQRAWNGDPAHTGYSPPSVLLSPAHQGAMGYLQAVARAFVYIAAAAGHAPRFQIGEPWWWVLPDGRPCLYDGAAQAVLGSATVEIPTVRSAALSQAQKALLDAAGAILAASTAALIAAVRLDRPDCEAMVLIYLPSVLDAAAPEIRRANMPVGWTRPAFDILQLEDYEWVTGGRSAETAAGVAQAGERLGYPPDRQHYLSGYVERAGDRGQWARIETAARTAEARGVARVFIWALPQIVRDGFTLFSLEEEGMQAFDDVTFPLAIGRAASVSPGFSTAIVTTAAGHEQRNMDWASGRLRFDAGPGIRSETDLQTLIAFFRARRGAARGFRFRDPLDHSSRAMTGIPTPFDQPLGTGDGMTSAFPLVKLYGEGAEAERRPITRPEQGSVLVAVNGQPASNWSLEAGCVVRFSAPPVAGAQISAGFRFDVPVRFAEDVLAIDAGQWLAGEVPSVPLVEIREG